MTARPGRNTAAPQSINAKGQVVGWYQLSSGGFEQGFLYHDVVYDSRGVEPLPQGGNRARDGALDDGDLLAVSFLVAFRALDRDAAASSATRLAAIVPIQDTAA
jgi:hypothetical protein